MSRRVQSLSPPPVFSDAGAQDNAVVVHEAQEWIEEVTGRTFSSTFRESLEDGVLLCELMKKIKPGSIYRINKSRSPIAHLDNIQQFLLACQELGMKEAQLFDTMDLQVPKGAKTTGVKRGEADRKIRSVCVTLYWLGRAVADMDSYSGPQLDLRVFTGFVEGTHYSDDEESNSSPIPIEDNPDHYQLAVGGSNHTSSPDHIHVSDSQEPSMENGIGLTFDQEQTADQLLADIQSAVDEMLQDFQQGCITDDKTSRTVNEQPISQKEVEPKSVGISVHMISRNRGFGFQVVGGADANYQPEVDLVLPGSAAEDAGIKARDKLVSVNKQDITKLSHKDLVSLIKKAGMEGSVLMGLVRTSASPTAQAITSITSAEPPQADQPRDEPDFKNEVGSAPINHDLPFSRRDSEERWKVEHEEREKQAQEIALMYPTTTAPSEKEPPTVSRLPPTTSVNGKALPTLVEYQEEVLLEQITEMLEKTPPPQSPPPSPPPSPLTPTDLPPSTTVQVQDDRESIERELKEIVLMEMTATAEQKQRENNQTNVSVSPSQDDIPLASPISDSVSDQQLSVDEQIEELLNFGGEDVATSKSPEKGEFDFDLDLPPPLFESPPPPKPTTEAPKRQVKKEAPPPPKPKPKKKPASLAEVTSLTSTIEIANEVYSTKPNRVRSPENNNNTRSKATSPTPRFTPPPPPISPPPRLSPLELNLTPFTTPMTNLVVAKEVGTVTSDDIEIVGDIKIHRVQHTRWTPKGSSTQTVASPALSAEEQFKQRYSQHYTQQFTNTPTSAKQNGIMSTPQPNATTQQPKTTPQPLNKRNSPKQHWPDSRRYTQPANMAGWQMPLKSNDRTISNSTHILTPNQAPVPSRTHWKSQEELRFKKIQPIPTYNKQPQQQPQQKKHPTALRQQSTPVSTNQYKTQSLPRGNVDSWRVNRSNTLSKIGVSPQRPKDGVQPAYAVQAKSQYELCSRCHQPLGMGTIMSIPPMKMQYHTQCFICRVCRAPLVKSAHNTNVLIKGMHPHCRFCGSNDQGVLTTVC